MITVSEHKKNKLKTPGYFIKRLKDNDFVTLRIMIIAAAAEAPLVLCSTICKDTSF